MTETTDTTEATEATESDHAAAQAIAAQSDSPYRVAVAKHCPTCDCEDKMRRALYVP